MITDIIPIKRTQERVNYDNGPDTIRCYGVNNPHYYLSSSGTLEPIDLSYHENVSLSTVGDAKISRHNITSVGIRKDGSTNKFLGLRPDNNQHLGTEQLEFTITDINLDGVNQTINLNTCSDVDVITTDLGSILIRSNRQGTRQLIKASDAQYDFKITFDVYLTGLEIQNDLVVYTDEIIRPTSSGLEEIKVSGDFYESDETGRFIITTSGTDDIKFVIDKPKLLDDNFEVISSDTLHTLELTSSGTLEYIKYADSGCVVELENSSYIDADIYYSETTDGVVKSVGLTWNIVHAITSGYATQTTESTYYASAWWWYQANEYFYIDRAFFTFDTDGIDYVPSCKLYIHGNTDTYNRDGVSVQQGTQGDTLADADFDAFSGTYFDYVASWDQNNYNVFTFNLTGNNAINTTGLTKLCVREFAHDYLDVNPGIYWQRVGMYFSDNTGTDYDPYLEITIREGGQKTYMFF